MTLFNAPNLLSLSRIPLGFGAGLLLVDAASPKELWLPLSLMVIAELTDGLDGWVARRFNQVSPAGKLIDPLSDSIYRLSIFSAFVVTAWLPLWMFWIFMVRDICVSYVRLIALQRGTTLSARLSGKLKAIIQAIVQILAVCSVMVFGVGAIDYVAWMFAIAAAVTIYSLLDYLRALKDF